MRSEPGHIVPVSVVIPCYRCSGTVERAIDSIVAQTHRPAEIVLVDDCSDDGTLEKLYALAERHAPGWIHVLSLNANSGPGAARNAGWDKATQDYVAFLDADDAWHPSKLEIQYGWMACHQDCVLTGHASIGFESTASSRLSVEAVDAHRVTLRRLLLSNSLQTSTVMVWRTILLRFDPKKRYCEDYFLWLQIVCSGLPAFRIDLPLSFQFKPVYGAGGLSGDLWRMEKGELDALQRLYRKKLIGLPSFIFATSWSLMKYGRRLIVASLRRT